jgi:hypothetical protein
LLLPVLASPSAGCGFLAVNGPPPVEQRAAGWTCTNSNELPALDTVFAVAATAVGLYETQQPRPSTPLMMGGFAQAPPPWAPMPGD